MKMLARIVVVVGLAVSLLMGWVLREGLQSWGDPRYQLDGGWVWMVVPVFFYLALVVGLSGEDRAKAVRSVPD